jgi:Ras-related protein Rab-7A
MNRYSTGKFTGQYKATIGADFLTKQVVVTDAFGQRHVVMLQIWDTAGQERFQSLGVGFYRGADAALLCYDVTDLHSIDNLNHWRQEFLDQVGGSMMVPGLSETAAQFPFAVLGNKVDKVNDRLVPLARAEQWCRDAAGAHSMGSIPFPHFETSAKTAVNVDEAFHEVARLALQYEDYKRRSQPPQLFVPPTVPPIDLRRQTSSTYEERNDTCC